MLLPSGLAVDYPTAPDIEDRLVQLLAGRAVEEVLLGTPTSRAGGANLNLPAQRNWLPLP